MHKTFDLLALDLLLDSIADLSTQASVTRQDFYSRTASKLKAGTNSAAVVIWVSDGKQQIRIAGQNGFDAMDASEKQHVGAFAREQLATSPHQKIKNFPFGKIFSGICQPANSFRFLLLLVRPPGEEELLGQVFEDLVVEVISQIEIYENSRTAEAPYQAVRDVSHVAQLVQGLGKSSNLTQLAFHLVNDLVKITNADRVSYLDTRGKIIAISGAAEISRKTSVVRQLTRLGKIAQSLKQPIEWENGEIVFGGKRLPRNVPKLVEAIGSPCGYAIPCECESKCYGVVIFEFFKGGAHSVEEKRTIGELISFSSPVIARANQLHSIPGIRFQNFLFNGVLGSRLRGILWLSGLALVVVVAWHSLFSMKNQLEIYGEGVLQPIQKQHVYAKTDGEINDLLVAEKSEVVAGQKLMQIGSRELEKDLIQVEGEIAEVQQQLQNLALTEVETDSDDPLLEETKRASEVKRLKIRLTGLKDRLAVFETRQKNLEIAAPIDGTIVTPDLRRRLLNRPITRGALLMTIANTKGEWEIELAIPDNRIEFIEQAIQQQHPEPLEVEFRLMSHASDSCVGKLESIDYRSDHETTDGISRVAATVSIPAEELKSSLRVGTRVLGKIRCGQRNNFFLLTYELSNRVRECFFW